MPAKKRQAFEDLSIVMRVETAACYGAANRVLSAGRQCLYSNIADTCSCHSGCTHRQYRKCCLAGE